MKGILKFILSVSLGIFMAMSSIKSPWVIIIIIAVLLMIDYHSYLRSGSSICFKDKTELEKDLREIQKLEAKIKLNELKN
jgi:uncharacterized membrane protein